MGKASRPFSETVDEMLEDDEAIVMYLEEALDDEYQRVDIMKMMIKDVVRAMKKNIKRKEENESTK